MTKHYEGLDRCHNCLLSLFTPNVNQSHRSPRNKYCSSCLKELYPSKMDLWWVDLKENVTYVLSKLSTLEELSNMPLMLGQLE